MWPSIGQAQKFGAVLSGSDFSQFQNEVLYQYDLGVRHFVVEDKIPFETLFKLDTLDIEMWVKSDYQFKISDNIVRNQETFRKSITELIIHYRTTSTVKGFILLWGSQYSDDLDGQLNKMIPRFREQTQQKFAVGFLSNQNAELHHFDQMFSLWNEISNSPTQSSRFITIEKNPNSAIDLRAMQSFFASLDKNSVLFLPGETIVSQPFVADFVRNKNSDPNLLVSTLPLTKTQRHGNWVIVILILVWLSYAVHYAFEPTYRKSIGRFFFNHSFFANDILNRHERIGFSSVIVLIQVVVLSGIMFETVFSYFFDDITKRIVIENLEIARIFDLIPFGFFILGVLVSLLIMGVSIFWLRFGLPNIKFLTQITPIYTWFYHAHLVAIPLVIVATMMNPPNVTLLLIGLAAWFMVNFGAFVLVCLDDAKQNISRKQFIYSRTLYPYIFLTVLVMVLMNYLGFFQTLLFAYKMAF